MRRILLIGAAMVLIPSAAYAGGGGYTSVCSGFTVGEAVSMLDSCFEGVAHFAPAETQITVSNDGALPHTFSAVDGSFDSGQLAPGQAVTIEVDEPGIYQVFCTLHGTAQGQGMAGVLIVGDPDPLPVTAPANMAVIRQAVAQETDGLATSVGRLPATIKNLTDQQADLIAQIEQAESLTDRFVYDQTPSPINSQSAGEFWGAAIAGGALGLALAALLMVRRNPVDGQVGGAIRPSIES